MGKGYNLPDGTGPNDPSAPWNQTEQPDERPGYRYESPNTKLAVAQETLDQLDQLYDNMIFLEQAHREDEYFLDSYKHISWIKMRVKQYIKEITNGD